MSAEQARVRIPDGTTINEYRARMEQHHQQMTMAVLMGYPIGTTINESGNFEKPVDGRRVDSDEQSLRNT